MSTPPERWREIQAAFEELVELEAEGRAARLEELRTSDPELCDEVEALLSGDAHADSVLRPFEGPGNEAPDAAELAARLNAHLGGRYTVVRELGAGGMATVFLATDEKHGRQVALKVLRPEVARALGATRFLREIETAAKLAHPHILPLHDSGEADGLLYYVMPYVRGESLRERLEREGALPVEEALRITTECAEALEYAHEQEIIHRDVKPGNILLSGGHAMVLDFGIARAMDVAAGERLTQSGVAIGTPHYMSPEQGCGGEQIDGRSDLYSLGCVLYEMLAGEPPFSGASVRAIVARHVTEPPPPIRVVRPAVPEHVAEALETALAKVPADRFPNAVEMCKALARPSAEPAPGKSTPARRAVRAAAIGVVTIGMVGAAWQLLPDSRGHLDRNQVVVFPVTLAGDHPTNERLGQNVALTLAWALNTTTDLRAVDGWQLLDDQTRLENTQAISRREARRIARAEGAGHVVSGSVLVGDSVRVILNLDDVTGDGNVRRILAVDPTGDPWNLGLHAAGEIVQELVGGDAPFDPAVLSGRTPSALEAFLRGEHEYRSANFKNALTHYRDALASDSSFTLAALRAAQAAHWHHEELESEIVTALENTESLPPRYAYFAQGLHAYLASEADSAVQAFRRALDIEPQWHEAWMALGEVYTHLLPRGPPPDSMAQVAFREVRRLDPSFTPVLYHLIQIALRSAEYSRAADLLDELRAASPDSLVLQSSELLVRCATESPDAIDWRAVVTRNVRAVHDAAGWFTVGGLPQPACANASWQALLEHAESNYRFAALLGLQGSLLGQQRYQEFRRVLANDSHSDAALRGDLYILAAVAGAPYRESADRWADTLRALTVRDSTFHPARLWFLGIWAAFTGELDEAERIADRLTEPESLEGAPPGDARLRELLAGSLVARTAAARGDSARALRLLSALAPTGDSGALRWYPWESLGGERMLLAELLLARGAAAEAYRVASHLEAPAAVPYAMYLPASLSVRERAARSLGYERLADQLKERRQRLQYIE